MKNLDFNSHERLIDLGREQNVTDLAINSEDTSVINPSLKFAFSLFEINY